MSIPEFLQLLFNISLPGILMFTGIFITLLGSGAEIFKIKLSSVAWKRFFVILGIPILLISLLLAILLIYKDIFDIVLSPPNWNSFLWLFSSHLLIIYLLVFAGGGLIYALYLGISEKSYAVNGTFVVSSERQANIRVDHKGGKSFYCIVKLDEVVRQDGNWNNKIIKDYPRIVKIIEVNEWGNSYRNSDPSFVFWGKRSPNLDINYSYEVTITLYRTRGPLHIRMNTVKNILEINRKTLSWNDK
jgi:hypothetical protein